MTDDLVKRLRELARPVSFGNVVPAAGTFMLQAADRIEQLEAALDAVVNWENGKHGLAWFEVSELARAALAGEKKDD